MGLKKFFGEFVEFEEKVKPTNTNLYDKPSYEKPTKVITNTDFTSQHVNELELEKFKGKFNSILAEENTRNFPGNDFFEFWQMKSAMNGIIPQDNVRYSSAFATWNISSKQPQNKEDLLKSANIYLGLIEKEITDFKNAYEAEFNQQVTNNNKLIEQKTKEVIELQQKLNKLNTEILDLQQQNSACTANLTSKYNTFMKAGEDSKNEILQEINNINQFI